MGGYTPKALTASLLLILCSLGLLWIASPHKLLVQDLAAGEWNRDDVPPKLLSYAQRLNLEHIRIDYDPRESSIYTLDIISGCGMMFSKPEGGALRLFPQRPCSSASGSQILFDAVEPGQKGIIDLYVMYSRKGTLEWRLALTQNPLLLSGTLGLLAGACVMLGLALRRFSALEPWLIVMLVLSGFYLCSGIVLRADLAYTSDLPGHLHYIRHMLATSGNWLTYNDWESFNPPLYYALAALFYAAGDALPFANGVLAVRLFSLCLYLVFIFYGLRTLSDVVKSRGLVFYAGAVLIAFWPSGMLLATHINNDVALYTVWSASFYYTNRWCCRHGNRDLALGIALVGIGFMIKSSAVIPAAIIAACILWRIRRGWRARNLLQKIFWPAYIALAAGLFINAAKPLYFYLSGITRLHSHFGGTGLLPITTWYFFKFNPQRFFNYPFIRFVPIPEQPYNKLTLEGSFHNYLLKTMSFGAYTFQHGNLATAVNALMLAFFVLLLAGIFSLNWRKLALGRKHNILKPLFAARVGFAFSYIALMAFTALHQMPNCQDFRYVLPMLVPMVILYASAAETKGQRGRMLYGSVALLLPLCAAVFFLSQ